MSMSVSQALAQRRSVRAFTPDKVARADIEAILEEARRAPSGGNLQPWKVIAVAGDELTALTTLAFNVLLEHPRGEPTEKAIYPENLWEPLRTRRFEVGEQMYDALGIGREDKAARRQWFANNFAFFGAPAALFFVMDDRFGHGQWGHVGMFMMAVMLAAEARGLATCAQECWGALRPSLKSHFGLEDGQTIWCGLAIGHEDKTAPLAQFRAERAPVEDFTSFRGF